MAVPGFGSDAWGFGSLGVVRVRWSDTLIAWSIILVQFGLIGFFLWIDTR